MTPLWAKYLAASTTVLGLLLGSSAYSDEEIGEPGSHWEGNGEEEDTGSSEGIKSSLREMGKFGLIGAFNERPLTVERDVLLPDIHGRIIIDRSSPKSLRQDARDKFEHAFKLVGILSDVMVLTAKVRDPLSRDMMIIDQWGKQFDPKPPPSFEDALGAIAGVTSEEYSRIEQQYDSVGDPLKLAHEIGREINLRIQKQYEKLERLLNLQNHGFDGYDPEGSQGWRR